MNWDALLEEVSLALIADDGEVISSGDLRVTLEGDVASNEPLTMVVPKAAQLAGWKLTREDFVLDVGELRRRRVTPGDRVSFPRGSVKSAAVGDVLGITCVFLPSGFALGVAPVPVGADSGGVSPESGFSYPEQVLVPPWWLPKRSWRELPTEDVDLGSLGFSLVYGWERRLPVPDVGVKATVRRRQQELVVAGVL